MTRIVLGAWLLVAGVVAAFVFYMSDEVARLEQELKIVEREIVKEQRALHILKAEWSYLNRPQRLAELSERHLTLVPLSAERLIGFEDLPLRRARLNAPDASLEGLETIGQEAAEP
ncbi:MAG: hypothetical protein R3245_07210 [Kiloniellales bacterium]|nr:hypothetical protein [Kiloniellales bacterium]